MSDVKVTYRLLGPGTFDEEAKDFRDGYAIERVETEVIAGPFTSRHAARAYMLTHVAKGATT